MQLFKMSDITKHVFKLLTLVIVNLVVSTTLAADPVATESKSSDSKTTESKLADTKISEFSPTSSLKVISINPGQANLGQQITIKVDGLANAIKLGKEKFELGKLVLYLDGYRLDGLNAESIDPLNDTIIITLGRNDKNKDKWISLLGSPYPLIRSVKVNLGYGDQQILPSASEQHIELIHGSRKYDLGH